MAGIHTSLSKNVSNLESIGILYFEATENQAKTKSTMHNRMFCCIFGKAVEGLVTMRLSNFIFSSVLSFADKPKLAYLTNLPKKNNKNAQIVCKN